MSLFTLPALLCNTLSQNRFYSQVKRFDDRKQIFRLITLRFPPWLGSVALISRVSYKIIVLFFFQERCNMSLYMHYKLSVGNQQFLSFGTLTFGAAWVKLILEAYLLYLLVPLSKLLFCQTPAEVYGCALEYMRCDHGQNSVSNLNDLGPCSWSYVDLAPPGGIFLGFHSFE